VVLIASAPPPLPPKVTVIFAVEVVDPAAFVAVSVYVVVAVGLTLVEPVAEVEVNVPGVMAIVVAPLVDQLRLLLKPALTLLGVAENELMVGLLAAGFTVTVTVDVAEPTEFVAFNVYMVVAVGLTLVEPFARVEVNAPGAMVIEVAPLVAQLSAALVPELIVAGLAPNDVMAGTELCGGFAELWTAAQPPRPRDARKSKASPKRFGPTSRHLEELAIRRLKFPPQKSPPRIRAPFLAPLPMAHKFSNAATR
jgi:hypothetical protein